MMTDENILEEMLDRATNPAKEVVDELGVQMFCIVVRSNAHLVNKAQEMIVIKIRSSNITEAIRAIALLEECMTQCGSAFQDEAAKFRFLNELIRLVSKKYQGSETSCEVKQRIMECMLLWTTEFPNKLKIHEAYDMLSKESGIEHDYAARSLAKRESVLGAIDEEMFAKLIKSNNPENFKRANLLLQYRMNQDSRRNELFRQHECMLQEVKNTIQLLNQMLGTYNLNDQDQNETMNELYTNCKKHKLVFHHLLELLDQADAKQIADTLDANGSLLAVMTRYKELVTSPSICRTSPNTVSLSLLCANTNEIAKETTFHEDQIYVPEEPDFVANRPPPLSFGCNLHPGVRTSTLINNDINEFLGTPPQTTNDFGSCKSTYDLAELSDMFDGFKIDAGNRQQEKKQYSNDLFLLNSTEFLEPDIVTAAALTTTHSIDMANGVPKPSSKKELISRKMSAIDVLSDELFQKILPKQKRIASFKQDKEKVTLNDLVRERKQGKTKSEGTTLSGHQHFELPVALDDSIILIDSESTQADYDKHNSVSVAVDVPVKLDADLTTKSPIATILSFKHLSDININLDNVTPSGEQLVVLNDDDMKLILNFTEERPSKHVAVIVISARNKSKNAIKDFQFEASVKKPCKVRLLHPTNDFMAPHVPFRPAIPINQIMLLLNPTGRAVDITCIVGYKLGDDPDYIKESIVAKGVKFDA